jgi:hypothetical protein
MSLPMKVYGLVAASLSIPEKGLWYDSDKDLDDLEEGWGAVLQFWAGWVIRPYTKPKYWFKAPKIEPLTWKEFFSWRRGFLGQQWSTWNPANWIRDDIPSKWNEWDSTHHGLIKFWFPLCPFVSVCAGRFGFYAGFKVWNLEKSKYAQMVGVKNIAPGNRALTLSTTIRRTRTK